MKSIDTLFLLFLAASLASTVILLLLLLARKLFLKRLSPRILHALWFIVLIKLLVPFAPQSPVSLFNLIPQALPVEWSLNQKNTLPMLSSESDSSTKVTVTDSGEKTLRPDTVPIRSGEQSSSIAQPPPQENIYEKVCDGLSGLAVSTLVWLGGLLFFGSYSLFFTLKFRSRAGTSRKSDNPEVLSVLAACLEKLGIRQTIPVYETSSLRSPCLYGLMKPRIYLPEDIVVIADTRQLTHILLHELTHYQRKDLWFNSLWTLAVWLHWYNPLVRLAMKKMNADREVACDAGALEVLGEKEAASYGMTLLMLSRLFSRTSAPRVNLSHFFEHQNETKRRVTMIAKFKKGSYKLSAAAILLVLALSIVLLTNGAQDANGTQPDVNTHATDSQKQTVSSFRIVRPMNSFKWFNRLDRAIVFSKFDFKVPDYLPEGYQLENVALNKLFSNPNKVDLIDTVTITYVSHFGQEDEKQFEMLASKGKGNMLEHNLLWGAPYSQEATTSPSYRQEAVAMGNIQGTLFTATQVNGRKPGTGISYIWQDKDIAYAVNSYSLFTQEELSKVVQSFVSPQQVQHVRYDGEGNSFPLYDEKDLLEAKNILGFNVKFPFGLPDTQLTLADSVLLKAGDQNTGFSFRQTSDALWNDYRAPHDSKIYDMNDVLSLYQSKAPLFNTSKLSFIRKLEINGIEISAYADNAHVYSEPFYNSSDKTKIKTQTYYFWEQNGLYYAANFLGMDKDQELNLKTLVLAPVQ
ncbi:M56 family metallopeptidase [Paenibacillus sp. FSL L8-0470]|uniref:M56 family metallopeptidase n=1 Tax=Paenibacillus sp. FSL L8-0470 TaxID=2954688 RepID=UPI0030FA032D